MGSSVTDRPRRGSASESGGTANPWLILFSVALGIFMAVIDISILNIALPSIADDLKASMGSIQWTLIGYSLTLTGLVPVFGRISDVLGRKRLFITGLLLFSFGSLLAALSGTIVWLIGARVVQAFGGALITTNSLAIVTDTFPPGKRGIAMGVQSILISGGAAIGPTLGGFLVTHFGWEAVFTVNLPIGAFAAILAARVLPPLQKNRTLEPIDWTGAAALMGGLIPLLLAITKGTAWGWTAPVTLGLIFFGLLVLSLFVLWELRASFPLIDLSLFQLREFTAGQIAGVFASVSMSGLMFLFPFYWQGLRGYSAQEAGLLMLPIPLTIMVVSPIAGRLSDSSGARTLASAGLTIVMAGLFLISEITAAMPIAAVLVRMAVFGVGLGLFLAPNNNSVMSAVPANKRGVTAGLLGTFRFVGQSMGVALSGAIFAAVMSGMHGGAAGPEGLPSPETLRAIHDARILASFRDHFVTGLRTVSLSIMPLAALGVFFSLLRGKGVEEVSAGKPDPS